MRYVRNWREMMTIGELIDALQRIEDQHGDLPVELPHGVEASELKLIWPTNHENGPDAVSIW
jgi:hypothetical protein